MTGHLKVRDQRTGAITTVSTKLFRATFNHGKIEETFFALNDSHASEVAHEIASRRRLLFDAVQRVETWDCECGKREEHREFCSRCGVSRPDLRREGEVPSVPKAECAAWPEARCTR